MGEGGSSVYSVNRLQRAAGPTRVMAHSGHARGGSTVRPAASIRDINSLSPLSIGVYLRAGTGEPIVVVLDILKNCACNINF